MAEFVGNDASVTLQIALRDRAARFLATPILSNGGRVMNVLDPDAYGWERVIEDARADGFASVTRVPRAASLARLRAMLGDDANLMWWDVFTGPRDTVTAAASAVRAARPLPPGWTIVSVTHPDEATIDAAQALNAATGIAPVPAYFMRGETPPGMVTVVRDATGDMAAVAMGTMRYHPDGPLAGWLFAGPISVSPDHQGHGLGARVLAEMLCDSAETFGWSHVIAQAKADNRPSVGMITRCGMVQEDGTVTIAVNLSGALVTR